MWDDEEPGGCGGTETEADQCERRMQRPINYERTKVAMALRQRTRGRGRWTSRCKRWNSEVEAPRASNVGPEGGGQGGLKAELKKATSVTALLVISGMGHQTTQQGKSCAAGATRWSGGEEDPGGGGMDAEEVLTIRVASAGGRKLR